MFHRSECLHDQNNRVHQPIRIIVVLSLQSRGPFSTPLSLCGLDWFAQCQQIAVITVPSNTIPPEFSSKRFIQLRVVSLCPPSLQITKKILPTIEILEYFRLDLRFATNRNSTLESRPNKKKKQEDDDNDDDDDDDGSRPTIHVNEKKKRKKGTTIKVKPGRAEMHGAFSSRATGDAVTSVNKQMDKRRGPPNWTLKEGARKRFERGHGFKARRPKRGCVLIRADRWPLERTFRKNNAIMPPVNFTRGSSQI